MALSGDSTINFNSISKQKLIMLKSSDRGNSLEKLLNDLKLEFNDVNKVNQILTRLKISAKNMIGDSEIALSPGIILQAENVRDKSHVYFNIGISEICEKSDVSELNMNTDLYLLILDPRLEFTLGSLDKHCINLISKYSINFLNDIIHKGILVYDIVINPIYMNNLRHDDKFRTHFIENLVKNVENKFKVSLTNVNFIGFDRNIGDFSIFKMRFFQSIEKLLVKSLEEEISLNYINSCPFSNNIKDIISKEKDMCKIIPDYKLKHVNHSSLQDYSTFVQEKVGLLIPNALALDIKLPYITKASDIDVKVKGKDFLMETTGNIEYYLQIMLPYEVEEDPTIAKFHIENKILQLEFSTSKSAVVSPSVSTDSGIECESGNRTSDNSSVSSQEEFAENSSNSTLCDNSENDTKVDDFNVKHFILSTSYCTQNFKYIYISVPNKNIIKDSINIICENVHSFSFKYMTQGSGFAPILFGAFVNVEPNSIEMNSLNFKVIKDYLRIEAKKKKKSLWQSIHYGLKEKLDIIAIDLEKQVILDKFFKEENEKFLESRANIDDNYDENEEKIKCTDENEEKINSTDEMENDTNTMMKEQIQGIKIPRTRQTSECFVTGSWPKGILKGRSRSFSDSHVDSSFLFGSSTDLNDEIKEDDEYESELERNGSISPLAKKSVHFNDLVSEQVFRVNASILGQRAKNQKKAQQKKRAKVRKMSEGNSSDMQSLSEVTASSTEEESNVENDKTKNSNSKSKKMNGTKNQKRNGSKGNKCKLKPRNKKKMPNLSNDMIFQLDDA